jgi:hypothetical protein
MFKGEFLTQFDRNERLTEVEDRVYDEMRKRKEPGPKEEDFADIFPRTEIKTDTELVQRIEKNYALHTERGEILEETLLQQIYHSCWFGDNCETVRTTKFDDFTNHTDFVIEWDAEDEIRLAVDTTVTNDIEIIEKKVIRIQNELNKKRGATIKYFQSNLTWGDNQEKGKIEDVPSVIINFDYENLKKLCEMVISKNGKEKLEKTSLQIYILEDFINQLEAQRLYLEKIAENASDTNIYKNIDKVKKYLETILAEKKASPKIEKNGNVRNEPVADRERATLLAI